MTSKTRGSDRTNEPGWSRPMGWTAVAVVAADWASKLLVTNRMAVREQVAVVERWVYLVRLRNAGVSFSFLGGDHGAWRTPLLVLVGCLGIAALARFARAVPNRGARAGIALLMAGAIGNLGDRIVNGGVTDFLSVRYFPFVFNVADLAITTGAVVLAWSLLPPPLRRIPASPDKS